MVYIDIVSVNGDDLPKLKSFHCPNFTCHIRGNFFNLEIFDVESTINTVDLSSASLLRSICMKYADLRLPSNIFTNLEVYHLSAMYPFYNSDLTQLTNIRHYAFTNLSVMGINEVRKKIKTYVPLLTSICVYYREHCFDAVGTSLTIDDVVVFDAYAQLIQLTPRLTHINGYTRDKWLFTWTRFRATIENKITPNHLNIKIIKLLWYKLLFFFKSFFFILVLLCIVYLILLMISI